MVNKDTLEGVMINDKGYLSIVATINGEDYVIGLTNQVLGRPASLKFGQDTTQYAIRDVGIWRRIGSSCLHGAPFPVVGYSSIRHHFVVLDELLNLRDYRRPLVVDEVRSATVDELVDDSDSFQFHPGDDDIMRHFIS